MRFAGNFHPEWGYLAPAPSFMRTVRIVAVATAIGAIASAAVVLSLVGRPAASPVADAGKTVVVVHSLVQPAEAAALAAAPAAQAPASATPAAARAAVPPVVQAPAAASATSAPAAAQANVQPVVPPPAVASPPLTPPPATVQAAAPAASESVAKPAAASSVAALGEAPPATQAAPAPVADDVAVTPEPAPKPTPKKHRTAENESHNPGFEAKRKTAPFGGPLPLLQRLFSPHSGRSTYYPN